MRTSALPEKWTMRPELQLWWWFFNISYFSLSLSLSLSLMAAGFEASCGFGPISRISAWGKCKSGGDWVTTKTRRWLQRWCEFDLRGKDKTAAANPKPRSLKSRGSLTSPSACVSVLVALSFHLYVNLSLSLSLPPLSLSLLAPAPVHLGPLCLLDCQSACQPPPFPLHMQRNKPRNRLRTKKSSPQNSKTKKYQDKMLCVCLSVCLFVRLSVWKPLQQLGSTKHSKRKIHFCIAWILETSLL